MNKNTIITIAIIVGVIFLIVALSKSSSASTPTIPSSFRGKSCPMGINTIPTTLSYYIQNGKYYLHVEGGGGILSEPTATRTDEITAQEYNYAYQDSKVPCNNMIG